MRKKTLIATALVMGLLAVAATAADALKLTAGPIVINAEGGFTPQALPKHENAPISLHGGGSISTSDGSLPPILRTLTILFDRHGAVETTGLEVCTSGRLQATTTPKARHACPNAIVGEGAGTATIAFPE